MLALFTCRQMTVGELDFNTFHLLTNGGSGFGHHLPSYAARFRRGGARGTAIIDRSGAVSVRTSRRRA